MRSTLILAVATIVVALPLRAQDVPRLRDWSSAFAEYRRAPGSYVPLSRQTCPLNGVDSLAIVSPLSRDAERFEWVYLNGNRVLPPEIPDTVRMAVTRIACDPSPSGGFPRLSGLVLERDSVRLTYRFIVSKGNADSLGGIRYMRGDSLSVAYWNGYRVIDAAWSDSLEAAERARAEEEREREIAAARERLEYFRSLGWPERFAIDGAMGRIAVGMDADMVLLIWGPPVRRNTTVVATGKMEQWVYDIGRYVYLENGKVTAVQSSQ